MPRLSFSALSLMPLLLLLMVLLLLLRPVQLAAHLVAPETLIRLPLSQA